MKSAHAVRLFLRRDSPVEGTDLLVPSVALPSILALLVVFGMVIGPASGLSMEKEDGTLLRYRGIPHGLRGYFTSHLEVSGSWRTLETVGVLGAWAVAGAVVTPLVLRRMARRSTGSQIEAAKEASLQWVR